MDAETAAFLSSVGDITARVILPARDKGPEYALRCAAKFLATQSSGPTNHQSVCEMSGALISEHNSGVVSIKGSLK